MPSSMVTISVKSGRVAGVVRGTVVAGVARELVSAGCSESGMVLEGLVLEKLLYLSRFVE